MTQSENVHQALQEILKQIPDIRQERIDQIRAALESGNYQISSEMIAERLVRDILDNQPPMPD